MEINNLVQTCSACPSQWEFTTTNNRPVYVRYRWGYLSVRIGPPEGSIMSAVDGREIYGETLGGEFDGMLHIGDLLEILRDLKID